MRTKIQILIFLIIVIASCIKAQQADRQLKDIPKGAKTVVITTAYYAIEHDGKWICGEKYPYLFNDLDINTTYYDRHGGTILIVYPTSIYRNATEKYYYS